MWKILIPRSVYKCLTARCNNILVIVPRDRTPDQDAFRIQKRQMSRLWNRGNLNSTSFVPRNMSITFILQIPMEPRSNLNSSCAFNPEIQDGKIKREDFQVKFDPSSRNQMILTRFQVQFVSGHHSFQLESSWCHHKHPIEKNKKKSVLQYQHQHKKEEKEEPLRKF